MRASPPPAAVQDGEEKKRRTKARKVSMVFTAPPIMELADRAPLSRWAHVSGNAPRCRLSIFSDHRLQHLPMFSPLLNHVHRQAPVLPVSASRRSLPRSVGPGFGRTPLAAVSDAARRQEDGQARDLAWAFVAQRHGGEGASAATGLGEDDGIDDDDLGAGRHIATLQRVAANMLPEGSERDLEECLRHFVLLNMPADTELCRAGAPAQSMYILLHGRVRVDATAAADSSVSGTGRVRVWCARARLWHSPLHDITRHRARLAACTRPSGLTPAQGTSRSRAIGWRSMPSLHLRYSKWGPSCSRCA